MHVLALVVNASHPRSFWYEKRSMGYRVKEVFHTLQGEGLNHGRASVFLRFSGCNLWSGREEDRGRGPGGCSAWCDTDFLGMTGPGGGSFATAEELAERVAAVWTAGTSRKLPGFVVCTGGEPLLQLDTALIDALKARDFSLAVETNGTQRAPKGIDWLTVSPKAGASLVQRSGQELKLVYPQEGLLPEDFEGLDFEYFFLQPRDGAEVMQHTEATLRYCLAHPQWRLGLQSHKHLGIP